MNTLAACRALALGTVLVAGGPAAATDDGLAERLRALTHEHGFKLQGIEKIGDEAAIRAQGDLRTVLRTLLGGYDYVLEDSGTSLARVIIVGARRPAPTAIGVNTRRQRGHHVVAAMLIGPSARPAAVSLIVDTGASSIVLPMSMAGTLGFEATTLDDVSTQTINGKVAGKAARLASVRVGGAVANDVEVVFLPDNRLDGISLLGMSFLDRYTVTLDEARGRLLLDPR